MGGIPDVMFVIDANKEELAIKEANTLGIPVVAILDSNVRRTASPSRFPRNDDASRAIRLYCEAMAIAATRVARSSSRAAASTWARMDERRSRKASRAGVGVSGAAPSRAPDRRVTVTACHAGGAGRRSRPPANTFMTKRICTWLISRAAMVKDLREKSGAGMMDCKKALKRPTATSRPRWTGCAPRALPPPPRRRAARGRGSGRRRDRAAPRRAGRGELGNRLRRPQRPVPELRAARRAMALATGERSRRAQAERYPARRHGRGTADSTTSPRSARTCRCAAPSASRCRRARVVPTSTTRRRRVSARSACSSRSNRTA